jgi:SAM-dependent methyltransferase
MHLDEYRKLAEVEDRMWYFRALNRRCLHFLRRGGVAGLARPRILDAGCGTGGLINDVRRAFPAAEIVGLDFSPRACELARARTGAEIVEGSITALPFPDASFDAIVSADVVCQVEDGARALREFARVARAGAPILVHVPALRWLWSYHDDACETKHRYTRRELTDLFARAGLAVEAASYANLLALPLIAARRKIFPAPASASDVRLYPAPIEAAFAALSALEHAWISAGAASPVGSSVFVAGRKPTA